MINTLLSPLSIGPLNVPWLFISIIAAWIIYQVVIKYFYKDRAQWLKVVDSILFNTLFIVILVWKISPIVFQFSTVIKNPAAILYLPGGTAGVLLGIIIALIFSVISVLRLKENRAALVKSLGFNFAVLSALILVLSFGTFLMADALEKQSPAALTGEGTTAAPFELKGEDGLTYRLSDYAGRAVIINFWASWCPPCKAELPELRKFYEELNPDDAVFLSVNLYTSEKNPEELPGFIEEYQINFPVLYDLSGQVAEAYAVRSIPTTVVIKPDGSILGFKPGAVTEAWLKKMVNEAGE